MQYETLTWYTKCRVKQNNAERSSLKVPDSTKEKHSQKMGFTCMNYEWINGINTYWSWYEVRGSCWIFKRRAGAHATKLDYMEIISLF